MYYSYRYRCLLNTNQVGELRAQTRDPYLETSTGLPANKCIRPAYMFGGYSALLSMKQLQIAVRRALPSLKIGARHEARLERFGSCDHTMDAH